MAANNEKKCSIPVYAATSDKPVRLSSFHINMTERVFIETSLKSLYPYLNQQKLFFWKMLTGQKTLIPDSVLTMPTNTIRRIVEIGCGDGLLTNTLALLFPHIEVVGIDSEIQNIAYARSTIKTRSNLKFICASPEKLPQIPCDRIIYNNCLQKAKTPSQLKHLIHKTSSWLTDKGDIVIKQSLGNALGHYYPVQELFLKFLSCEKLSDLPKELLEEMGLYNPVIQYVPAYPSLSGLPLEMIGHISKTQHNNNTIQPVHSLQAKQIIADEQEWEKQPTGDLIQFLFADTQLDFRKDIYS